MVLHLQDPRKTSSLHFRYKGKSCESRGMISSKKSFGFRQKKNGSFVVANSKEYNTMDATRYMHKR